MTEHWITAATALQIVSKRPDHGSATHALCDRAHADLIKTKAQLLTAGGRRLENVEIPPVFWWARGHEALEQDWGTGDFSTWIEQRHEWRVFGVTFALSGVLAMLPFEQRAVTARRLSVAGSPAWMPTRSVLKFAVEKGGIAPARAQVAILDQAKLGFLTGRAVLAQRFDDPLVSIEPSWEGREWDVPQWFWLGSAIEGRSSQDWERGQFHAEGPGPNGDCLMRLSGVHFLAESLQVLLPAEDDAPGEAPIKATAGGRPPQAWWDDMWCAVWGLINQGDLKPDTQADIERAMLTWATMRGHDVSESTVKPKARKLFQAYKGEVRNFLAS